MSNNAQDIFERGKKLHNEGRYAEALKLFSECSNLEPQNAKYHAALGAAWYGTGHYHKTIKEANRAIQLDSTCEPAYKVRGGAYKDLKDYKNCIIDYARYYQTAPKKVIVDDTNEAGPLIRAVHDHFTNSVLPQIQKGGERFVEYWYCGFAWGRESKQDIVDGNSYSAIYGSYGTGYLCLTDKNIRIISLGQLSQQFAPRQQAGILGKVILGILGRTFDYEKPEKEDKVWTIPSHSISDVHGADERIVLSTATTTWEIFPVPQETLQWILTGINMTIAGQLSEIWSPSQSQASSSQPSSDAMDLLKQLGELKAQGIITETEFEQKKKELLARL